MIVLGIESTCDETAAALVENGRTLLSNVIATSVQEQALYGGVVPEIASRRHCESISATVAKALADAGKTLEVQDYTHYKVLGRTVDDAAGEAFDKVARTLGLPYPGGPSVSNAAKTGDPKAYRLPVPHVEGRYNVSFSGLKTAVLNEVNQARMKDLPLNVPDLAASFQERIAGILAEKLGARVYLPELKFCGDNGAMIAAQGYYQYIAGHTADLTLNGLPTLPIDYE